MTPTKKDIELALEMAVKVVVNYDDVSDCNGRCPLSINCAVQNGGYLVSPERKCFRLVKAHFIHKAQQANRRK